MGMHIDVACTAAEDEHATASPVTISTEPAPGSASEEEVSPEVTHKKAPWNESARSKKQAWTAAEDEKLLELVNQHGASQWSTIASHLEGRVGKQCRERWHNHLSPEVKKEHFSAEEDRMIVQAVAEHGTKWALMVKLIPGRTDNAIKNRWNSTTRRMLRVQRRDGTCPIGASDLDLSTMSPSELAKHMLASGLDPMASAPPARRKIALSGAAQAAPEPEAMQGPQGLQLLSHLSDALQSPASPHIAAAALSLGELASLGSSELPSAKRRRRAPKQPRRATVDGEGEGETAAKRRKDGSSDGWPAGLLLPPVELPQLAAAAEASAYDASPRTMHAVFSLLTAAG